jgi:hypothetical protein
MALLARKEETVIAASNFVLLPLTFLSSAGLLAALCLACTWLATRAFRTYQRSI